MLVFPVVIFGASKSINVDQASAGQRLDAFVARHGAAASVAAARRLIAAGLVRVDGRIAKKGAHLVAGQSVEISDSGATGTLRPAPELRVVVLYEDTDLVAVDKPAGIPSHPLLHDEGPTVAAALVALFPECANASPDPREGGIGHRLDLETSGVLLGARNRPAWEALRAALAAPDCTKTYYAEVVGAPPALATALDFACAGPSGVYVVTAAIGRTGRRGARVKVGGKGRGPLEARTEIVVLEQRESTTLVEARLSRGRAHQVRAHLAYLGCPVLNDAIYGASADTDGGLRLHAAVVELRHPRTGAPLRIEAPPPRWATLFRTEKP